MSPGSSSTATAGDGARYAAFISYSRRDFAFAARLHRQLESYRLPRGVLVASHAVPAARRGRLGPMFRDREELAAAGDLTQALRESIAASRFMIVVCSPDAAASDWVGREIALFRGIHGEERLLAALIAGEPETAFPPALTSPGPDGRANLPLAADFRPGQDGRLALLKLIAPIVGQPLDQLVRRDAQRRTRQIAAVAGASLTGLAVAGGLSLAALSARLAAEEARSRGEAVTGYLSGDLRQRLKAVGSLDLLRSLNEQALRYYRANRSGLSDQELAGRARALQASCEDDITRGDWPAAHRHVAEAWAITDALSRAHPGDALRVYGHAQSEYWRGYLGWREDDDGQAAAGFEAYARLAARLVASDPDNPDWRMERAYAASNLGMFSLRHDPDTARADALYQAAQADFLWVQARRPRDRVLAEQVEDGDGWLADIRRLDGDTAGARALRFKQRRIIQALLAADPHDYARRLRLATNDLALGRIADLAGDAGEAQARLAQGRALALQLAQEDPNNADAANQARAMQLFQAKAWLDGPRATRPPERTIRDTIGDCSPRGGGAASRELQAFCTLLSAQRLAQDGRTEAAVRMADPIRRMLDTRRDRYSERWLIDLRSEARRAVAPGGVLKGER